MLDPTVFRDVLAQWPSGVTIVTTLAPTHPDAGESAAPAWHGMTASSFSSVSLAPPLVSSEADLDEALTRLGAALDEALP